MNIVWNQRAPSDPKGTEQDSGEPRAARTNTVPIPMEVQAGLIVDAILKDLRGRKGIRHAFDEIEEDIQDEIRATLVEVTEKALLSSSATSGASAAGVSLPTSSAAQASVEGIVKETVDEIYRSKGGLTGMFGQDIPLRHRPEMEAAIRSACLRVAQAVGSKDLGEPRAASGPREVQGQMKYCVLGDHPVLARPDKYGLTFNDAVSYSEELVKAGYEGVTIREQAPSDERQPKSDAASSVSSLKSGSASPAKNTDLEIPGGQP